VQISVILRDDVVRAMQSTLPAAVPGDRALRDLLAVCEELGVSLRATHPGTEDPSLKRYFSIDTVDAGQADAIVERLLLLDAVDGAYPRPTPFPPGQF
jgi:hypothetical protein